MADNYSGISCIAKARNGMLALRARQKCLTTIKIKKGDDRGQKKPPGGFKVPVVHVAGVDCHHRQHRGVDAVAQPHATPQRPMLSQSEFLAEIRLQPDCAARRSTTICSRHIRRTSTAHHRQLLQGRRKMKQDDDGSAVHRSQMPVLDAGKMQDELLRLGQDRQSSTAQRDAVERAIGYQLLFLLASACCSGFSSSGRSRWPARAR